nr:NADAR family protein [Campylobacter concisus]
MKALGRQVRGFDAKVWDEVKFGVVLNASYLKFS